MTCLHKPSLSLNNSDLNILNIWKSTYDSQNLGIIKLLTHKIHKLKFYDSIILGLPPPTPGKWRKWMVADALG